MSNFASLRCLSALTGGTQADMLKLPGHLQVKGLMSSAYIPTKALPVLHIVHRTPVFVHQHCIIFTLSLFTALKGPKTQKSTHRPRQLSLVQCKSSLRTAYPTLQLLALLMNMMKEVSQSHALPAWIENIFHSILLQPLQAYA